MKRASPLLRFLSQRAATATSRLRNGLRLQHTKAWSQPDDGEHSERASFHWGIRRQIEKLRAARAMRDELYALRGAA